MQRGEVLISVDVPGFICKSVLVVSPLIIEVVDSMLCPVGLLEWVEVEG